MFTSDAHKTLQTFKALHGGEHHLEFQFKDWTLIGIGDLFIVGGTEESLTPIRDSHGPIIVDDLDEALRVLEKLGAKITVPLFTSPTGRGLYARHADGTHVEYVEWTPELVERFVWSPHRAGKVSSQL